MPLCNNATIDENGNEYSKNMIYSDIEQVKYVIPTQLADKGTTKNAYMQAFGLNFYSQT